MSQQEVNKMVHTSTNTYTYTKPRIEVLEDHFELFFTCAGLSEDRIKKHLISIRNNELQAVGVYLEQDDYRIAEVELDVDWNAHHDNIRVSGSMFDTDIPGWKKGAAPEAYIAVQKLGQKAKELKLTVRCWIRVSSAVRSNPNKHKQVCDTLGYNYGGSVPPWRDGAFAETSRQINGMSEATVTTRKKL
jgi:hypothetical protein